VSVFADMRKSPNADETIKAIDIPKSTKLTLRLCAYGKTHKKNKCENQRKVCLDVAQRVATTFRGVGATTFRGVGAITFRGVGATTFQGVVAFI